MKKVFADTVYWIAIVRPNDQWKKSAERTKSVLGNTLLLTTDEVLGEFLNALSGYGDCLRCQAVKMVKAILKSPNVRVIAQSRDSFLRGVDLYGERPDKQYSLTDCISMIAMRSESVNEILTNDAHFEQEGFKRLMNPAS